MVTLNIHRADGTLFEKVPVRSSDISGEGIARMFHIALLRDKHFYATLVMQNKPIAMVYSGEDKNIVRVVFCDNNTNQEFKMD